VALPMFSIQALPWNVVAGSGGYANGLSRTTRKYAGKFSRILRAMFSFFLKGSIELRERARLISPGI